MPLQKLPKNVGNLGKLIVAKSGHTGCEVFPKCYLKDFLAFFRQTDILQRDQCH